MAFGGSDTSTTRNLTADEIRFEQIQADIGELQKSNIEQQTTFQKDLLASGNAATPEQQALIRQARDAALAGGTSDIQKFQTTSLESLREELAPSLGFRSSDTPILDRGARVAEEATRQVGRLTSDLDVAAFNQELNFPLQSNALIGSLGLGLANIGPVNILEGSGTNVNIDNKVDLNDIFRIITAGGEFLKGIGVSGSDIGDFFKSIFDIDFSTTGEETPGETPGEPGGGLPFPPDPGQDDTIDDGLPPGLLPPPATDLPDTPRAGPPGGGEGTLDPGGTGDFGGGGEFAQESIGQTTDPLGDAQTGAQIGGAVAQGAALIGGKQVAGSFVAGPFIALAAVSYMIGAGIVSMLKGSAARDQQRDDYRSVLGEATTGAPSVPDPTGLGLGSGTIYTNQGVEFFLPTKHYTSVATKNLTGDYPNLANVAVVQGNFGYYHNPETDEWVGGTFTGQGAESLNAGSFRFFQEGQEIADIQATYTAQQQSTAARHAAQNELGLAVSIADGKGEGGSSVDVTRLSPLAQQLLAEQEERSRRRQEDLP